MVSLAERDRQCLWHPFTQMGTASLAIPIASGKDAWLVGEDGRHYLDAFSSWWVNLHGHGHPYLIQSIIDQIQKLQHVVFTDFTHEPAVELAERLLSILPNGYTKVFFSDNGATAIEAALKIAIQFWDNRGESKKKGIVCFRNSYHGDTFGAMAVAGKGSFNRPFWSYLFDVIIIDPPEKGKEEISLNQLRQVVMEQPIAAMIFEPYVQGVGGMRTHSLEGLDALIAYCDQNGVLTIADEIMTGFGRTGPYFVSQQLKQPPSIICLAKGITGGMLPLAATICQQRVYDAFFSEEREKAFLHGHSYFGNPLACAVALASLDLLKTEECTHARRMIEKCHKAFCEQWKRHPALVRLETIGTILAVEYRGSTSYFQPISGKLKKFFLDHQILVRPMGNVLHLMPPYCIKEEELQMIYRLIVQTLESPL